MESLPNHENVYRIALISNRDKKNKNIPAERCFSPTPTDKGKLSIDIESLTTSVESLARWGSTHNWKGEFKEYEKWEIYSLNVQQIKLIDKTIDVYRDPLKFDPPEKGKPDNLAHGLIGLVDISEIDLPEVVLKLRDHAKDQKVQINMDEVHTLVEEYRKQWD